MTLAAYKKWATGLAARGAFAAECEEIRKGFTPVGTRTYEEGFIYGQRWARALTVSLLRHFREWYRNLDPKDEWCPSALWLCVYKSQSQLDDEWCAIHKFWNIDPDGYGRISHLARPYLDGFLDAARGVAERVYSNIP
jgi:hypothetical protein